MNVDVVLYEGVVKFHSPARSLNTRVKMVLFG